MLIKELKKHFPFYLQTKEDHIIEVPICKPNCKKCWGKGYVRGKRNDNKMKYLPVVNNTGEEIIPCTKATVVGINLEEYSKLIEEKEGKKKAEGSWI